ncbi:hypothetical protein K435DRAFT_857106 [Dendrothele bispora CBS 962.96]|uniref:Nephrocystin 3-like N-terminal domain-containing protein n=1 Tax=Dendrothele bispora (strain CBS 962.96) TaxID=1314807 RepID=A0A4S8M6Q1_DENBC|nr:hypothetical protein K435DRAFT_857106 [Dendrothele bispora CBS 962.96]
MKSVDYVVMWSNTKLKPGFKQWGLLNIRKFKHKRCDSTLAFELARFDHRLGEAIVEAVTKNEKIVNVTKLSTQFDRLILEPLQKHQQDLRNGGSIVIIVDGLDECTHSDCADTDYCGQLLQLLVDNPFRLFPFVRLVLASRPEENINRMLTAQKHIVAFTLDISSDETRDDIKHFLEHKLSEVVKRHPESEILELCRKNNAVDELSMRASGLFIWVSTVVALVTNYPERLKDIMDTATPKNAPEALNILYKTALKSVAGEVGDADIQADIRSVLGRIMAANSLPCTPGEAPLTPAILNGSFKGSSNRATRVLEKLWSLVRKDDGRLSLLHKSFDDFLIDDERCPREYCINMKDHLLDWITICTKYFIHFLEENVDHPCPEDSGAAFHRFVMTRVAGGLDDHAPEVSSAIDAPDADVHC